jgi:predicted DNA-binding antitoxin AbrB/MazE fold protein
MNRVLEAIYENGVLTPLEPLDLPERQHVVITLHLPVTEQPDEALLAWQQVYAGLSEADISEVEQIALDRSRFMRQED